MNEEELQFLFVMGCGGILALVIILDNLFSISKLWARYIRSKTTPTPEELVKAHTVHSTFYHYTHQRLFSTTYISFYLFVLSCIGLFATAGLMLFQNFFNNALFSTDERFIRWWSIFFFFLLSRWNYRQDHTYIAGHKLTAIICGIIWIDFVHMITGESYIQVGMILLMLWIWIMGFLGGMVTYETRYRRNIAFSIGLPFALLYFLIRTDAGVLLFIIGPAFILAVGEFIHGSEFSYTWLKKIFPRPLPFFPAEPDSFIEDIGHSMNFKVVFKHCSFFEIVYWGLMTPILLIPAVLYLQSREEQLKKQHDKIIEWTEKEYVLNPETVADRLGMSLVRVYPLLNEMVDTGELTVYESSQGLQYGLSPSGEMKAFVHKFHLRKTELPTKDREVLEYIEGKTRIKPAKTVMVSVIKQKNNIEVSTERVGGTVSAVVSSVYRDAFPLEKIAKDMNKAVKTALAVLKFQKKYKISDASTFLSKLRKKGETLFECVVPDVLPEFDMPFLLLETNIDDIPFELMWDSEFFALQYGMGRRLKVTSAQNKTIQKVEGSRGDTIRALIIADPTDNLPEAVEECEIIRQELERFMDVTFINPAEATCERVSSGLGEGYTIIHYAGHVTEKGLQLADGVLQSDEIITSVSGRPLIFINGCKSAGIAHTELAKGFLQGGALGYIGSMWEIHDKAAARLAVDFYLNAFYFYRIGEALRMAKERAFKENNFAWLCFVLFGDPTLTLL